MQSKSAMLPREPLEKDISCTHGTSCCKLVQVFPTRPAVVAVAVQFESSIAVRESIWYNQHLLHCTLCSSTEEFVKFASYLNLSSHDLIIEIPLYIGCVDTCTKQDNIVIKPVINVLKLCCNIVHTVLSHLCWLWSFFLASSVWKTVQLFNRTPLSTALVSEIVKPFTAWLYNCIARYVCLFGRCNQHLSVSPLARDAIQCICLQETKTTKEKKLHKSKIWCLEYLTLQSFIASHLECCADQHYTTKLVKS